MTPRRAWLAAGIALIPVLLGACATGGGTPANGAARMPSVTGGVATSYDTTWYISARERRDGHPTRELDDSLEFGMIVTRFRARAGTGSPFLESLDAAHVDSAQLTATEFARHIRAADQAAAARGDGAVVYVHGFAVSFGRAISQGAEIAHRGSFRGPMIVFAWPAHTAIATWPVPSAIFTHAYRDDSASASESRSQFLAGIRLLVHDAVRPSALVVVGHSLGAQLVAEALAEPSVVHDSLAAHPLGAAVFFAPDMPVERFRDTLATRLEAVANRRIVYASSADWMLSLSRLVNHAPRAGRPGPARTLAAHDVEVVDVTDGLRADGMLRKLVEPQHSMRWASSALYDFFAVVRGVSAACRTAEGVAQRETDGTWRLTDASIPVGLPVAATCDELHQHTPPIFPAP